MFVRISAFVLAGLLMLPSIAHAGNVYKVTGHDGERVQTYQVRFGGGKLMDQFTAFDPKTHSFVYLTWERTAKPPTPKMEIWDHQTGETVPLYEFPGVDNPLPVIPSIEAMKVCPITKDKQFKATLEIVVD